MAKIEIAPSRDAALIAQLHAETITSAYAGYFPAAAPPPTREDLGATWRDRLANSSGVALVAIWDTKAVGCVMARQDPDLTDEGEMVGLHVLPGVWGRGIGSALHDAAIASLTVAGHRVAGLWVIAANQRARRMYETRGWVLRPGVKFDFMGITEVRYQRNL